MKDFFQELTEYTQRDRILVEERCKTAIVELAWQWEKLKNDPLKFYRESDLYIFDLSMYQNQQQKGNVHEWYRQTIFNHDWKTMLDYGGGIGEWTIVPAQLGLDTSYLDMKDSETIKYALWRFNKYNISPTIFYDGMKLDKHYDFIVAMDIFEHIENPDEIIKNVCEHTDFIFANPDEIQYNPLYPQHISHFDLNKYCVHIDQYLWKVK